MAATFESSKTLDKHPTEVLIRTVDFSSMLQTGESITGTPTVTVGGSGHPTVSDVTVIASGKKVRFKLTGGSARTLPYVITVLCTVVGGASSQQFIGKVKLLVTAGTFQS